MKHLLIGAAVAAATLSIGSVAAARDYGYGYGYGGYYDGRHPAMRYHDSDGDGRSDYREWNRDRDRDGRPDQWDRRDNRRHWRHHRGYHNRHSYYRHYDGPRYGYYHSRPYRYEYRRGYYDW